MQPLTYWSRCEAPEGMVFLCQVVEITDTGVAALPSVVLPALIAESYSGSSDGIILLPKPSILGAFHHDQIQGRAIIPFALPLPSLVFPASKLSITPIPAPPASRWPTYVYPFMGSIYAALTRGALSSNIAEASHTPIKPPIT